MWNPLNISFWVFIGLAGALATLWDAAVTRAIAWANFRDNLGAKGGWLPMFWLVNFQKGATPFAVYGLMTYYNCWTATAWAYLIAHSTYCALWLLKEALFPDGLWRNKLNTVGALAVWCTVLGAFWITPWVITSQHIDVPTWWLACCVPLPIVGGLISMVSDGQKARAVAAAGGSGRIVLQTGLWSWSRHPNYFGDCIIYGGLAIFPLPAFFASGNWWALLPSIVFAQVFLNALLPNILRIEARMAETRGTAWQEYADRVPFLIPRLRLWNWPTSIKVWPPV